MLEYQSSLSAAAARGETTRRPAGTLISRSLDPVRFAYRSER
jgi:hypothetical protein